MDQFQADPGYAFRFSQGQKALERSAAMRGGLLSGNTGGALQQYGQGMASQEYQNAFNRYQAERQSRLGPLQSLAGIGQTSVNALGQAGGNYANSVGNIGMNQANIAANAGLAGQQARSSSYGQVGNALGKYLGSNNYNYAPFGGGSASFGEGDY
jgi:hypothetical protein